VIPGIALIALGTWVALAKAWHLNIGDGKQMFYDVPRYFTITLGLIVIRAGVYLML
jgi:hypothetical protein